jgi:Mg2+ and Co2+ transporter CorA
VGFGLLSCHYHIIKEASNVYNYKTTIKMEQASARLETAAASAYDLIQGYADKDPRSDDPQNPWLNPEEMHGTLSGARLELMQAWEELKAEHERKQRLSSEENEAQAVDPEEFRALYMDMITDAFADALEGMRQQKDDDIDLDILVDCLQSGIDLLDSAERDSFFRSFDDLEDEDEDALPIHEIRRRELGYDVEVSS